MLKHLLETKLFFINLPYTVLFFFLSHELSSAAVSCLSKSKSPVQALLNSYYSHALECLFVSGLLIAIAEFL